MRTGGQRLIIQHRRHFFTKDVEDLQRDVRVLRDVKVNVRRRVEGVWVVLIESEARRGRE